MSEGPSHDCQERRNLKTATKPRQAQRSLAIYSDHRAQNPFLEVSSCIRALFSLSKRIKISKSRVRKYSLTFSTFS